MAASSITLKLTCLVLLCMAVSAPVARAAVTCGQVVNNLTPCISYVTNKGPLTSGCCSGIKSLNSAAQTTPDRQAACSCLKSAAGNINGVNYGLAGALPGKCGVSIPYPISPSTDCSKVN